MKRLILFCFIINISILANEKLSDNEVLDNIRGNAGHIGLELSLGINTFEYNYILNNSSFKYLMYNNINKIKPKIALTYFSTDFNRYSFLFESNINLGINYFSYKSFSFGILDNIYLKNYFSFDFGMTTILEGNYKFLLNLGFSYYFIRKNKYYLIFSEYFNILLNSIGIENTLYIKWMYIF